MFQSLITSEGALANVLHRLSFTHQYEPGARGRAGSPAGERDSQLCPLYKTVTSIHSHLL